MRLDPPDGAPEAERPFGPEEGRRLAARCCENPLRGLGADALHFAVGSEPELRAAFHREVSLRELFEAPTVARLAKVIQKKLEAEGASELPPVVPLPRGRSLPLSLCQERLFAFSRLLGGDFLNMPYGYRLNGHLDVAALRAAVQEIVRRHAILRTAFMEGGDGPRQMARSRATVKVPLTDLSALDPENRAERMDRLSRRDAAQCFDLEKAPLLRVKLLRLDADSHLLLVTMHHMITDQWSMGVFRRELAALYEAFSMGLPSPLPDLPFQYGDFVAWQRRLVSEGLLAPSAVYWQKRLAGPAPRLKFRAAARPKKEARYHSTRKSLEIDDALFAGVKRFAAEQNCTSFIIFLTGLFLLLRRITGQSDLRIAALVANRSRPGTDGLIGYFVNALILRVKVPRKLRLKDLLEEVRATCLSALAHADLPFEYLEELLERAHGRRGAPPYQVMLNYRSAAAESLNANGLTIASWGEKNRAGDPGIAISRHDVNVHLHEMPTRLTGAVNFRTDLFDDGGMVSFLKDYSNMLDQLIRFPDRRISRLICG